jgi:hypothetical protein
MGAATGAGTGVDCCCVIRRIRMARICISCASTSRPPCLRPQDSGYLLAVGDGQIFHAPHFIDDDRIGRALDHLQRADPIKNGVKRKAVGNPLRGVPSCKPAPLRERLSQGEQIQVRQDHVEGL